MYQVIADGEIVHECDDPEEALANALAQPEIYDDVWVVFMQGSAMPGLTISRRSLKEAR